MWPLPMDTSYKWPFIYGHIIVLFTGVTFTYGHIILSMRPLAYEHIIICDPLSMDTLFKWPFTYMPLTYGHII